MRWRRRRRAWNGQHERRRECTQAVVGDEIVHEITQVLLFLLAVPVEEDDALPLVAGKAELESLWDQIGRAAQHPVVVAKRGNLVQDSAGFERIPIVLTELAHNHRPGSGVVRVRPCLYALKRPVPRRRRRQGRRGRRRQRRRGRGVRGQPRRRRRRLRRGGGRRKGRRGRRSRRRGRRGRMRGGRNAGRRRRGSGTGWRRRGVRRVAGKRRQRRRTWLRRGGRRRRRRRRLRRSGTRRRRRRKLRRRRRSRGR